MSQPDTRLPPVLVAGAAIEAALDDVVAVDPTFMDTGEKAEALLVLSRATDRLEELRMRVLAAAQDVAERDASRDPAAWLAHRGRRDAAETRRRLRLARSLAHRPVVREALGAGRITVAQAEVITSSVEALPEEVTPDVRSSAESRLVDEAAHFGPRALRVLGRRVVDVVAPEVAEGLEQRMLEQEERAAARRTYLRAHRNGDGTSELRIRVADAVLDRLLTYLDAFASPRRTAPDDRRPHDQRLGAASGAFLEAVDPQRLPVHGGDATTVLVTVDLEVLRGALGTAQVSDQPLSAGEVRRLACTSGILPVVLGGAGQVIDAGRERRLFTGVQRRLLAIRQPTCAGEGCDIPAAWCEAHHGGDPWSRGGRTDLADGVRLCSFHHHRAHDHRYRADRLPDGGVRFHRRT